MPMAKARLCGRSKAAPPSLRAGVRAKRETIAPCARPRPRWRRARARVGAARMEVKQQPCSATVGKECAAWAIPDKHSKLSTPPTSSSYPRICCKAVALSKRLLVVSVFRP